MRQVDVAWWFRAWLGRLTVENVRLSDYCQHVRSHGRRNRANLGTPEKAHLCADAPRIGEPFRDPPRR